MQEDAGCQRDRKVVGNTRMINTMPCLEGATPVNGINTTVSGSPCNRSLLPSVPRSSDAVRRVSNRRALVKC